MNAKKYGIINNTTYVSHLNTDTHMLISMINETNNYDEFLKIVKNRIKNLEIGEKDFNRKKKVLISNEIFAYENVEMINDIIIDNVIFDGKFEDNPIEVIEQLNYEELCDLIKKLDIKNTSTIILKSNER